MRSLDPLLVVAALAACLVAGSGLAGYAAGLGAGAGADPGAGAGSRTGNGIGKAAGVTVATPVDAGDGCASFYCAEDAVFQVAPLQALTAGVLDGPVDVATPLRHGDFGIGGLAPLDGELVLLEGSAWHAALDGTLRPLAPRERVSVFFAKRFRADLDLALPPVTDLDALVAALDAAIGLPNRFHAVRIDGRFARLSLRSVARQAPPFRPVTEVVREQNVFELEDVAGTLVGFRFPGYLSGVNAGGYHFHFVDAARSRGGHVLGVEARGLRARIDSSRALTLVTPDDAAFDAARLEAGTGSAAAFREALRPAQAEPGE